MALRRIPFALTCWSIFSVFGLSLSDPMSTNPPNIVVIIADDLGWNDVSFHGADEIPTPNIDALAYYGVTLNRHYVLPTCTPSRTSFLTGRYPIRTGMQGFPLRGAEPRGITLNTTLLPEYLRRLGYATHLVGKWHVGYHTRNYWPTRRGFDTFFGYYSGYIEYFSHELHESQQKGYDLHRIVGDSHKVEYRYDYFTDLVTEEAENIILSHQTEKPLYLQLAHLAPHSGSETAGMEVRSEDEMNAKVGYIEDIGRRKYAAAVVTLDESVGRVVDALRRADMLKNSIVVFISDNGAQTTGTLDNRGSNYPLRGLKFSMFEGGVRCVACVYSPLINSPSRVSTELFHVSDWLPTFYAAAGGDPYDLKNLDGIDQWLTIKDKKASERTSYLVNIDEKTGGEAAQIGRYKLIKDSSPYRLYYGYDGNDASYPKYDATKVLTSPAASAIQSISLSGLAATEVLQLRNKSVITCGKPVSQLQCFLNACLFNIDSDPCETTDLSSDHPEVVERLNAYIAHYKSVLMEQTSTSADPVGFPYHFNNTWMTWLPDDYQPDQPNVFRGE